MKVDDIVVSWVIPTFDRRIKGPMPLPTHYYELDWTKASKNEQAEIIKILGISDKISEQEFSGMGIQSTTWSVGANKPDDRMLRFRQMFVERPIEEQKKRESCRIFKGVNLHREYFEDETGQEISVQEMIQITTGNKNVILFDAEHILKIGPTDISNKETWSIDKANTLFNFIQAVRLIWRSSWAQKRSSMTISPKDKAGLIKCNFPTVENMCAILTLFRQFYASDALMENTCKIYNEHCSNLIKKEWAEDRLKVFEHRLGDAPGFIQLQGCTVKELFDAFLYGTGLVHSSSNRNKKNKDKLLDIVKQHGREKVILAVNESFWMILRYAFDVFHIVKQDYEYWTEQNGCEKSDMFDIYSLLRSHHV